MSYSRSDQLLPQKMECKQDERWAKESPFRGRNLHLTLIQPSMVFQESSLPVTWSDHCTACNRGRRAWGFTLDPTPLTSRRKKTSLFASVYSSRIIFSLYHSCSPWILLAPKKSLNGSKTNFPTWFMTTIFFILLFLMKPFFCVVKGDFKLFNCSPYIEWPTQNHSGS